MNSESAAGWIAWLRLCLVAAAVLAGRDSECRAEFIIILDDRAAFEALLTARSSSTVIDSDGRFAPDPATGTVDGVTRTGTIGGESYSYRAADVDFSNSPTGRVSPGTVGDDIDDLDRVSIESPVGQSGAIGTGSWGLDSGSGSTRTPNALLVDFEVTPFDEGIYHFGADLHDFETSEEFGPGQIRLYDDGELMFASPFAWSGSNGNGDSHFLGVVGARPFDQVAIVVGDDDGNGSGTERWAADRPLIWPSQQSRTGLIDSCPRGRDGSGNMPERATQDGMGRGERIRGLELTAVPGTGPITRLDAW